jgi:hypothetical protein
MNSGTYSLDDPLVNLLLDAERPDSFEAAVKQMMGAVITSFKQEIAQKQLYYHSLHHVMAVQRRSQQIFQALRPYWQPEPGNAEPLDRLAHLLDLCAITHDWVQEFLPQAEPHTPRRRASGVSERATIDKLNSYIDVFNRRIQTQWPDDSAALFQPSDRYLIQEAIMATICVFDPVEQAIFQPDLYDRHPPVSYLTRILALADIGSLAMEGIESYNQEGSLLFLEENLDLIPLIQSSEIYHLSHDNPELAETWRQRLLRRTRFQVHFAHSRFNRTQQELAAFPPEAIAPLTQTAFPFLRPDVLSTLESTTPTDTDTPLATLVDFFQFPMNL